MQVKPLSTVSLESSSLICDSTSLFSEFDENLFGGAEMQEEVDGTLPLVADSEEEEEDSDFSEHYPICHPIDDSEYFSYEELAGELSSDSSDGEPAWVRTKSGRPGKILQTAEDEFETIALIETMDGETQFRHQKSYRLSTQFTQKLVISASGNYRNYVPPSAIEAEAEENTMEKKESPAEQTPAATPLMMDRFGNIVIASALKKKDEQPISDASTAPKGVRFAKLNDASSPPIERQVTKHVKALYVYQ